MTVQPRHSEQSVPKSKAKIVPPGRMPLSEFLFDRAGAPSPFGDDVTFPLPVESLTYEHPAPED